jgi:hypothetical protein
MKENESREWEYLSTYWRKGEKVKLSFSKGNPRLFSHNTIESGLAWDVFSIVRKEYPKSRIVLYADVRGQKIRVKYYNPNGEQKVTSWHSPSDFYAYIPMKEFK